MTNPARPHSSWVRCMSADLPGARKLVCLPHAGAGPSAYAKWCIAARDLGISLRTVHYPGREGRNTEQFIDDANTMVKTMLLHWKEITGGNEYAMFGHSMGALLAFAVCLRLQTEGRRLPDRLFLSGIGPRGITGPPLLVDGASDLALLQHVRRRYGSIPDFIMADPELHKLFAAPLRADLQLVQNFPFDPSGRLAMSATLFGGSEDPCTAVDHLIPWQRHFARPVTIRILPGAHFFFAEYGREILREINDIAICN